EKPEVKQADPAETIPAGPTREVVGRFRHTFAERDGPPGITTAAVHIIELEEGMRPPKIPARERWSPVEQEFIEKEIQRMLDAGVIRHSQSPASAQVVLAVKKGNKLRFCVDYRRLNLITRTDAYPMPRADDSIDRLTGARVFCTLDVTSGYW